MRSSLFLLAGGLLLAAAFIYCSDPVSSNADKEIIPLKVGYWWEFDICTTYADDSFSDTTFDTLIIVDGTLINDTTWYISYWVGGDKVGTLGFWANLSGGLWFKSHDTSYLWIKYPTQTGEINNIPGLIGSSIYFESVFLDTTIDVPAGQFSCHLYREMISYTVEDPDTIVANELFYVPGVGSVRYNIYTYDYGNPEPSKTTCMRLTSYHLE